MASPAATRWALRESRSPTWTWPLVDQLLNARAAQFGQARRKIEIQAAAGVRGGDGEAADGDGGFSAPMGSAATSRCWRGMLLAAEKLSDQIRMLRR